MKKIGIILVNYNGMNDTAECIDSIHHSTYSNYCIYVIDNHSNEDCSSLSKLDKVKLIALQENMGFGIANNIGAKQASDDGCELIMCLNNDTIIDKDMLQIMCENTHDKIITTCAMYYFYDQNRLWYGGGESSKYKGNFRHKEYTESRDVSFITGCCFAFTKECLNDIGLFDDKYFMYYEDADFSMKAILNGYTLHYIYEAKIWHKVGKSIDKTIGAKDYYLTRNRLYLLKKYSDYFFFTSIIYFYVTRILKIVANSIRGNDISPITEGIKDFKNKKMGKRVIQRQSSAKE